MRTRLVIILVLIAVMLIGANPAAAITYGTPDGQGHPHVGLVVFYNSAGFPLWRCSGTLLSPTVFLTAGHCTFGAASAQVWFDSLVIPAPGGYPFFGGVTGTPHAHPSYNNFAAFPNTFDVGVVVLDTPVVRETYGALPALRQLDALATRRGKQDTSFTVVGYGLQEVVPNFQADRERYVGTVKLVNLRSALTGGYNIQSTSDPGHGGGLCFGDSGGPAFLGSSNVVAGVSSFVLNLNCKGAGFSYRTDIPEAQDFILGFLSE